MRLALLALIPMTTSCSAPREPEPLSCAWVYRQERALELERRDIVRRSRSGWQQPLFDRLEAIDSEIEEMSDLIVPCDIHGARS